ncbi:MAG: polyprenol monophosphomannose synthase [Bacteroidia bacterium]
MPLGPLVIIPTYNEKPNIKPLLESILGLEEEWEVLVVDDNSPDGTAQEVKKVQEAHPQVHLLERPAKEGLGRAYEAGFRWALERGYPYIFEMDADFSHDPKDLSRLCAALKEGIDLVIGSRYIKGITVVNWPFRRILLSYLASLYVRLVTRMPIKDSTAGFVGYQRELLEVLLQEGIRFKGYAFQIEMKYKAWLMGAQIMEIPIVFTERTQGRSKMNKKIIWEAITGVLWLWGYGLRWGLRLSRRWSQLQAQKRHLSPLPPK